MSSVKPTLPTISDTERTPLVDALLEVVQWQSDRIEQLEDAIHALKKQTRKPKFKSSDMDKQTEPSSDGSDSGQKKGPKRSKTQHLSRERCQVLQSHTLSNANVMVDTYFVSTIFCRCE